MGTQLTYLNKPNKEKIVDEGENDEYEFVAWSMQGWRINMEDAHLSILDFNDDTHLFGVFDGHGGKEVAIYVSEKLPSLLKSSKLMSSGKYEEALQKAYIEIDSLLGKINLTNRYLL